MTAAHIQRPDAPGTVEVLEVLGQVLDSEEVEALSRALPPRFATALRGGRHVGEVDLAEVTLRVAGRAQVSRATAAEYVKTTCRAIADTVTPEALQRLRYCLPTELSRLFSAQERPCGVAEYHLVRRHHSLAEARPGSEHPLSEARPSRAQCHSVARDDAPHADTKLSSAEGLTQEREHETLATGRGGSANSLSRHP